MSFQGLVHVAQVKLHFDSHVEVWISNSWNSRGGAIFFQQTFCQKNKQTAMDCRNTHGWWGVDMDVSKIGVPQNGWFIIENPIKMDDLGVFPLFLETPICYFFPPPCWSNFPQVFVGGEVRWPWGSSGMMRNDRGTCILADRGFGGNFNGNFKRFSVWNIFLKLKWHNCI